MKSLWIIAILHPAWRDLLVAMLTTLGNVSADLAFSVAIVIYCLVIGYRVMKIHIV